MSPRLQAIVHGVEWGVGSIAAAAIVIGGTGGLLSVALNIVHVSAVVAVIGAVTLSPATWGFLGTAMTGLTAILVARIQAAGKRREASLGRIEAKVDDTAGKVTEIHLHLSERIAALEARVPAADSRARDIEHLKQDVARIQGHLRRDA